LPTTTTTLSLLNPSGLQQHASIIFANGYLAHLGALSIIAHDKVTGEARSATYLIITLFAINLTPMSQNPS
jgi:hypothetical protein